MKVFRCKLQIVGCGGGGGELGGSPQQTEHHSLRPRTGRRRDEALEGREGVAAWVCKGGGGWLKKTPL